jgi:hypothetical protein
VQATRRKRAKPKNPRKKQKCQRSSVKLRSGHVKLCFIACSLTSLGSDGIISSFFAFLALIPWFSTGSMVSLIPSFITYHSEVLLGAKTGEKNKMKHENPAIPNPTGEKYLLLNISQAIKQSISLDCFRSTVDICRQCLSSTFRHLATFLHDRKYAFVNSFRFCHC